MEETEKGEIWMGSALELRFDVHPVPAFIASIGLHSASNYGDIHPVPTSAASNEAWIPLSLTSKPWRV